ncbi:heat-inducible transcriptional repressor HrcA [Lachnospiraceae bacterium NSJ-143]|nr:heat-inducible transcriptional repressor HrcA [Lachnospiraceae bacterium NSJ-143]
MSLDERKLKILQAIITDYIATAEPVGSRTIAKKYDLGISSATIRNEMSDLEEMGFIIQPHASSGRIPSDLGYRLYVDRILKQQRFGEDDKKIVNSMINRNVNQIQYLMDETARLISKMTNYTTIFSEPVVKNTRLNKIRLMSLNDNDLMIIVAAEGNIIRNRIVNVNYMPDEDRLYEISGVITGILHGQIIESIGQEIVERLYSELNGYSEVVSVLIDTLDEIIKSSGIGKLHFSGTNNMLAFPEFSDIEKAKSLFKTLEKTDSLSNLLSDSKGGDLQIYIGNETGIEEMKDCSIVTTTYEFGDNITGTIGILGPTRMDYSQVVSVLNSMVENIEDVLNNLDDKKKDDS